MTQEERRRYLIEYLWKEEHRIRGQKVPEDQEGQEKLLRSLMNIRMPRPVSEEFLQIQDAYLQERNRERGITDLSELKPVPSDSRLYIWQGDSGRDREEVSREGCKNTEGDLQCIQG